jgi:hypothetical protein
MRYEFVAEIDALVKPEGSGVGSPSVLIITKSGKYLRGHIIDHNVRMDSAGKVRGRLIFIADGIKKEVDANDISSFEKI